VARGQRAVYSIPPEHQFSAAQQIDGDAPGVRSGDDVRGSSLLGVDRDLRLGPPLDGVLEPRVVNLGGIEADAPRAPMDPQILSSTLRVRVLDLALRRHPMRAQGRPVQRDRAGARTAWRQVSDGRFDFSLGCPKLDWTSHESVRDPFDGRIVRQRPRWSGQQDTSAAADLVAQHWNAGLVAD
jgi:hypothetical protein